VGAATLQARFKDGAREDIIANAAITLYKLADAHPGFTVDEIHDQRKRGEIAIRLRDDPAKRRALVDEWRKTVAPWPPEKRVPHLVARLEDADPDNAIRAMRELSRLLGDATGFPAAAMQPTDDDTAPRNAVREWRKTEAFRQALEHWKAKAR
jgi:hypothetical protein